MGQRGFPPSPTEILKLRGSRQIEKRHAREDPPVKRKRPPAPKEFGPRERAVWRSLCKSLEDMGIIGHVDGQQMARYCVLTVKWWECSAFVDQHGMTYPVYGPEDAERYIERTDDGRSIVGYSEYKQVARLCTLSLELRRIEQNFALTPADRARFARATPSADAVRDEMANVLDEIRSIGGA